MRPTVFENSPFKHFMPVRWHFHGVQEPVYSITHGLSVCGKLISFHLNDPVNHDREAAAKVLLGYQIGGRLYNLYTYANMENAAYAFDESGFYNIRGDLAERVARRLVKRFLQTFDRRFGRLGGLFSNKFDPKSREGFVVAHCRDYVLKIGRYPNMILLKRTGRGKWGYQHLTDLDGLFDYRYGKHRHLIILESKIGKIDVQPEQLFANVLAPMRQLFPDATLTYALFAQRSHLFDQHYPEYRMLQETPKRTFQALEKQGVPTLFFEFHEEEKAFETACRHLITSHRTLTHQAVSFHGQTRITHDTVTIFSPASKSPYMELKRNPNTGQYELTVSPHFETS